ncbi:MAG: DUF1622 domain-containing protein [Actinomycetota bacterium]|nr:DUF1622 domain-containing protein [Actinomycetota bacterium]
MIVAVGYLRLVVEALDATIIGTGAVSAVYRYTAELENILELRLRLYFGRYLVLGLEFQLGSGLLSTAVTPASEEVQLLAAIVVIRTVLNYFRQKEFEQERKQAPTAPEQDALSG